ncbi:MAG: hypothetical protein J5691_01025 [Bacilli bacterium]|nr:hypothetical protein [Bacilli bacterium]
MAVKYVIKADTEDGILYYMNFMMTTSLKECAQPFKSRQEAEHESVRFKYLYNKPYKITIERI